MSEEKKKIDIRHYNVGGNLRLEFGQQVSFLDIDRPSALLLVDLLLQHLNGTLHPQAQPVAPAKEGKLVHLALVKGKDFEP